MKATTKGNLQSLLSMLQLHLWSWKFSRFFTCIHLLPCTLSFTVNNTFVLKVSETQFSLTASYILAFMWHDKRIFFKETPQTKTHVLDYGLLNKIWTPKLKVDSCLVKFHTKINFAWYLLILVVMRRVKFRGILYHSEPNEVYLAAFLSKT